MVADDHGRFALTGIHPAKSVILVEQSGFRLQGWLVDPSAHVDVGPLTLVRANETPEQVMKPLADPIPPAESRAWRIACSSLTCATQSEMEMTSPDCRPSRP